MIGLGGAGQRHLRVFRDLLGSRANFIAFRAIGRPEVITPSFQLDNSLTVEENYGVTSYYRLENALSQTPDFAIVSNPSSLHVSVAIPLANAGCHLYIEKPLSHSIEYVDDLIRTCQDKNLVTMVTYQMRFHPCLAWIKDQLLLNRIGKIQSVEIRVNSYMPGWHPYEDFLQLYAARKDLGGGVILTEIHEIDYACWFFGMPRRVFAVGGNLGSWKLDVEDTVSLTLECGNEISAFPVQIQMSMVQQPPNRGCQINGEKGQILWDAATPEVRLYLAEARAWETISFAGFERSQLFTSQAEHFLECLETGARPIVDISAGADSLKVALAAKRSLESGLPAEIK